MMLDFLRSDLADLEAYTPHPRGEAVHSIDRLDTNESPFDLPPELKEKLAWIYRNQLETNRYPDASQAELKAAIAQYVSESAAVKNAIAPENISLGNGSDELIRSLLIATCVGSECAILAPEPTFSMYGVLAKTLAIPIVRVGRTANRFEVNIARAQYAIEWNSLIRAVFVAHPNSPTANLLSEAELDWLRGLPKQILVVIDEAYFEFSRTSVVSELHEHPNWVILRTFSKAFRLAALRVGYAIAHPELIRALETLRLPYNLPGFSQAAALIALEHRRELLQVVGLILEERDRLYRVLSQLPEVCVLPSQANFLYLRPPPPHASQETLERLVQALKDRGTLVRHTGGGLRLTVGTPEENSRAIERLQQVLAELL